MVDESNILLRLIDTHDEIEGFIARESYNALTNFYEFSKEENKVIGPNDLSSSTVCLYALSQYLDFWREHKVDDKEGFRFEKDSLLLTSLYKKNFEALFASDERDIDEFTLLNTAFHLMKIEDNMRAHLEVEKRRLEQKMSGAHNQVEIQKEIYECKSRITHLKEDNVKIGKKVVRILNEHYGFNKSEFFYERHIHPFIYYKLLYIFADAIENGFADEMRSGDEKLIDFDKFFVTIYEKAKYELYRQLSLNQAGDSALFDEKSLIYSLLTVTYNNKFSNNLIKNKTLEILFDIKLNNGLWPEGQDVIDKLKTKLITVECLNDLLDHKDLSRELDKYQDQLYSTYNEWLKSRLRRNFRNDNSAEGWYPEFEGPRLPKSWVTGHSLIFLKKYLDKKSEMIDTIASKTLKSRSMETFEIPWEMLRDSYGIKLFISKIIEDVNAGESPDYRSALIHGPPGSGKSTVAKSLARELGWEYVEINPGQFMENGYLQISKTATDIFKKLKRMRKKVIFFDEVDQMVRLRDPRTETSSQYGDQRTETSSQWFVNSILPEFSELRTHKDIVFLLATNNIDIVDRAIMRRGRIDFVLPMGSINWHDRLKVLRDSLGDAFDSDESEFRNIPEFVELKDEDDVAINDLAKNDLKKDGTNNILTSYLERTDFMIIPDILNILKLFKKSNWHKSVIFDFFFEAPPSKNALPDVLKVAQLKMDRHNMPNFKEFHQKLLDEGDIQKQHKNLMRIPLDVLNDMRIDDLIKNNVFRDH